MKNLHILGGGTFSHVRNHLALAAPAFGGTARQLEKLCEEKFPNMAVITTLTKMADQRSNLVTNEDVARFVETIVKDLDTKVIFFNVAMCDYNGEVGAIISGKYAPRLRTMFGGENIRITPTEKIIGKIRDNRKDVFVVGFKTTTDSSENNQYLQGLNLLKKSSINLVLANDVVTRRNMIITPEEARYHVTMDRKEALEQLVDMTWHRSQLTFTKSTVVDADLVPWNDPRVFPALREVVNYCIRRNAYKPFNGATVGHFACKVANGNFLTSIRKSNFNDLEKNGLVHIMTDGDDSVIAFGAKPSVGGQSQRIVFSEHPEYDCIVHFHCPIKDGSKVPTVSQREYECGSHQCGQNTSKGLKKFGNLSAVYLDNHGPNIVFNHTADPNEIIAFIEDNFDLASKTGGMV